MRIEGQYTNMDTQPYKGGDVIDCMLSYFDELDSDGYDCAMEELAVIQAIEAQLS